MKNNKGFTLVEILIGISISIILMISVSTFIVSGIKNITLQKNVLSNSVSFQEFYSDLNNLFSSKDLIFKNANSSSGFLLKTSNYLGNGLFSYIGVTTQTGYCLGDSSIITNHLKVLNFTPFERQGYDIFSNKSFSGDYTYGTGNNMYVSDTYNHVIYFGDKTNFNSTKQIIVGRGVFGDKIGTSGVTTYLNNPTGIAYGDSKLFISDTGNNRILYLSGTTIFKLLDIYDGILEPTGLFYTGGILYISNSGKNEILSYSSDSSVKSNLNFDFSLSSNINSISKISISFKDYRGADISVSSPTNSGSFTFSGFTKNTGDNVGIAGGTINYSFSGAKSLNSGNYNIGLSTISGSFLNNGSYYVEVLLDGTPKKTLYIPFFTKGSSYITDSKSQNVLKILTGALNSYPTGLYSSGNNLVYNDFLNRKYFEINNSGTLISSGNLTPFNFESLSLNNVFFKKTMFPINSFYFNTSSGLLNFKVDYFKNYDCDDSSYNILKTLLSKVNIKEYNNTGYNSLALFGWKQLDSNCNLPDITIGAQTWAGCNSTLGNGLERGQLLADIGTNNYNGNLSYCYQDHSGNNNISNCIKGSANMMSYANSKNWFPGTNLYGDTEYYTIWGKFYSWSDSSSACPSGRHVPTEIEWTTLEDYLYGGTCRTADGWKCPGLGWRRNGSTLENNIVERLKIPLSGALMSNYIGRGDSTFFWSSTDSGGSAYRRGFQWDLTTSYRDLYNKGNYYSVRCIKN